MEKGYTVHCVLSLHAKIFPSFWGNICVHMNWDVHSLLVVSSRFVVLKAFKRDIYTDLVELSSKKELKKQN